MPTNIRAGLPKIECKQVVWNHERDLGDGWIEFSKVLGMSVYHTLYLSPDNCTAVYVQVPESGSYDGLRAWATTDRTVMSFDISVDDSPIGQNDWEKTKRMIHWVMDRAFEEVDFEHLTTEQQVEHDRLWREAAARNAVGND